MAQATDQAARFWRDTEPVRSAPGRYALDVDPGWCIYVGPNGGYVAAQAARSLAAGLADLRPDLADRPLRSLSAHYLHPASVGPMEAAVTMEHAGRSVSILECRLSQPGGVRLTARGVFADARDHHGVEVGTVEPPTVEPPERLTTRAPPGDFGFADRYQWRWAYGGQPWSGGEEAVTGGWVRLAPGDAGLGPTALDSALVVAYTDSWMPAVYSVTADTRVRMATVDLSVHLVAPPPRDYDDWVLVAARCDSSSDGMVVEDAWVWTRTGRLLAKSRQLAVLWLAD